jgi:hypothetical protein
LFDGNRDNLSTSFHNNSILKIPNQTEVTNLHKLFGIGAEFSFLEDLIKFIIRFKFLTPVLNIVRKAWNVYCLKYRIAKNISWKDIFKKFCLTFL